MKRLWYALLFLFAGCEVQTSAQPVHVQDYAQPTAWQSVPPDWLTLQQCGPGGCQPTPAAGRQQSISQAQAVRSRNFVVQGLDAGNADAVAKWAEHWRQTNAILWTGAELPDWPAPCPIAVKVTTKGSGGATWFQFSGGRVASRQMQVEGSLDRIVHATLPHEISHTILADVFGCPLPRWADEGAACCCEDDQELIRQDKLVREVLQRKLQFRLGSLFRLADYPKQPDKVMALYAQGFSVSHFLISQNGPRVFLSFVRAGMGGDWDGALRQHYSYQNTEALESAWLGNLQATAGQRIANCFQPKGQIRPGPITAQPGKTAPPGQVSQPAPQPTVNPHVQQALDALAANKSELQQLGGRLVALENRPAAGSLSLADKLKLDGVGDLHVRVAAAHDKIDHLAPVLGKIVTDIAEVKAGVGAAGAVGLLPAGLVAIATGPVGWAVAAGAGSLFILSRLRRGNNKPTEMPPAPRTADLRNQPAPPPQSPSPSPPPRVDQSYVPVPTPDPVGLAYQRAAAELAKKYPGSLPLLRELEAYKQQLLPAL